MAVEKAMTAIQATMDTFIDKDFQLTHEDIETGNPDFADTHAIALAVRRFLGENYAIEAHPGHLKLRKILDAETFSVWVCPFLYSDALRAWVARYDRGEAIEPVTLRFSPRKNYKPNVMELQIVSGHSRKDFFMDFYEKEVERIYQALLDKERELWRCEPPQVIKDNRRIDACMKDTYRKFLKLVLREGVSLAQFMQDTPTKLTDC